MIKAVKHVNGVPYIVFGLSRMNTEKLLEGNPILIDLAEIGVGGPPIVIVAGEDEESIMRELRENGIDLEDPQAHLGAPTDA